jgi:hypothetical protein
LASAEIGAHCEQLPPLTVDALQSVPDRRRQIVRDSEQVLVCRSEREYRRRQRRDQEECAKESQSVA